MPGKARHSSLARSNHRGDFPCYPIVAGMSVINLTTALLLFRRYGWYGPMGCAAIGVGVAFVVWAVLFERHRRRYVPVAMRPDVGNERDLSRHEFRRRSRRWKPAEGRPGLRGSLDRGDAGSVHRRDGVRPDARHSEARLRRRRRAFRRVLRESTRRSTALAPPFRISGEHRQYRFALIASPRAGSMNAAKSHL